MTNYQSHRSTIRTLTRQDLDDFYRVVTGYQSPARYDVQHIESPQHASISLTLRPLATPYVHLWSHDEFDMAHYAGVLAQELSLAAHDGDLLVGLAIAEMQRWNRSLWVWEFHVAESHRGQGIGQQMMAELVRRATPAGMRTIVCETQNTNVPAIQFYRAQGFTLEGIDLSYYTNDDVTHGEVALFMKRKL